MTAILPMLVAISITAYLASSALLTRRWLAGELPVPWRSVALTLASLGALLHLIVLWQHIHTDLGVSFGFFHATSLIGILMTLLWLGAILSRQPLDNLGLALLPLTALTLLLEALYPAPTHILQARHWQLELHIASSLLAYSLLSLAALQALLLLLQDRHLHARRLSSPFLRVLPPLETMERLLVAMLTLGFGLLSLALLSGFFFLHDLFAQHLAHKAIFALAAWGIFGSLLLGRRLFGWRSHQLVRGTLGGTVFLVLAYLGSKFVSELLLGRVG